MPLGYQVLIGPGPATSMFQPWTDISQWVNSVDTQRGRSTELDDIQAGTCTLMLDNDGGYFTPGKTVSQNLLPPNVGTGTDTYGTTVGFYPQSGTFLQSTTSNVYAGTNSLKMTLPNNATNGIFLFTTDFVPVTAGWTYNVSGALRNTVTAGYPTMTVGLSIHWVDANRQTLASNSWGEQDVTMAVGDGWHSLAWSLQAPAGAAWAQLLVVNRTNVTTGTSVVYGDSFSITRNNPFAKQVTNNVPIRVAAVQNGNLLPYQIANVDHWNDQTIGDKDAFGLWSTSGTYYTSPPYNNMTTALTYSSASGGLVFGHASGTATTGALAYIVTASRITHLPAGTYTLKYVLNGISFGSGAQVQTVTTVLNWANGKASASTVSSTTTSQALVTGNQTVSCTVTIPTGTGLTGLEIAVVLPCASSTASKVAASQFQLVAGTTVPAFQSGDAWFPLFGGWIDTFVHTTKGGAGLSDVEVDCTDNFRSLGNVNIGSPYQSLVLNDPAVLNYWPMTDAASTTLASVADLGPSSQPMTVTANTSASGQSVGITAGAAALLTAATTVITPIVGSGGGVVNPNHQVVTQQASSVPQPTTSFKWAAGNAGNCGAAAGKAQFPYTGQINGHMPAVGSTGQGSFDCWIELDVPSASVACNVLGANGGSGTTANAGFWVQLSYNSAAGSHSYQITFNGSSNAQASFASGVNPFDGNPHHVALTWTITTSTITWNFYLDGSLIKTDSAAYSTKPTQGNMIGADFQAGGTVVYNTWAGRISDVALTSSASLNIARRIAMGKGNYSGNEPGRFGVIMDTSADCFIDAFDQAVQAETWPSWASSTVVTDALKAAAAEVGGVMFIGRTGNPCYNSRNHAPPRQVFQDQSGTSADDGLQFAIDGDHIVNQVIITLPDGSVVTAVDRTSVQAHGLFKITMTASYQDSAGAQTVANNIVSLHANPLTRVNGVTISCINPTVTAQALGLDIGARVTLAGLPESAPAASLNWIVQSVSITGAIDGSTSMPVVALEMSPDLAA